MENVHVIKEKLKEEEKYLLSDVEDLVLTFCDGTKAKLNTYSEKKLVQIRIMPNYKLNNPFKFDVINNYSAGITVTELARLCGFKCTRTFQRHFKEEFGETVYSWMFKIKMEDVRTLVRNTDIQFAEISEMFKFKCPAHLSNAYKKHFGVTPSKDREKGLFLSSSSNKQ